ncbi:MAG: hypothetical protein Q7S73_00715 [bacterium]|nr:hypothetical protein [bacterium]
MHWITNKKFILGILFSLIFLQILWNNGISEQASWHWFDNVMHFLGGAVTAQIFLSFLENRRKFIDFSLSNNLVNILVAISFVALIGVLWEFYEYLNGYIFLQLLANAPIAMELSDTLLDLFSDLLGGAAVAIMYFSVFKMKPLHGLKSVVSGFNRAHK